VGGRERDFERFLTFVDAVVAIAVTLLVLPLAEVGAQVGDRTVAELLRNTRSTSPGSCSASR
jgi:uncharacterized membrane protein